MHVSHSQNSYEAESLREVESLFKAYHKEFQSWAKKNFSLSEEDRMDIFQDAIIIFYENSLDGKTERLKSSKKTYLFGIAKNLIYSRYREQQRMLIEDDFTLYDRLATEEGMEQIEAEIQRVEETLSGMEEPCKSILTLFYYYNADLDSIKEQLNYSDKTVLKTQKSRCLKYLKDKLIAR